MNKIEIMYGGVNSIKKMNMYTQNNRMQSSNKSLT